jgi:hypothetical protein
VCFQLPRITIDSRSQKPCIHALFSSSVNRILPFECRQQAGRGSEANVGHVAGVVGLGRCRPAGTPGVHKSYQTHTWRGRAQERLVATTCWCHGLTLVQAFSAWWTSIQVLRFLFSIKKQRKRFGRACRPRSISTRSTPNIKHRAAKELDSLP